MSSVPKTVLSEAAIAVPIGTSGALAGSRTRVGLRAWMITALLFMVPLITYWPATFHDYGLRDDYSNIREAHEEPGKVLKFCASHARPIYGLLLQATYGQTSSVQNLKWMRFAAALLLGALSLVSFRGLRALGWSFNTSLCVAVLLALVPSAQVIAAWAVGWPYVATALLAVGGFFTAEGALNMGLTAGTGRAIGQWAVAIGLMVVSALIYQPSAMFYVVPMAAALITRQGFTGRREAAQGSLREASSREASLSEASLSEASLRPGYVDRASLASTARWAAIHLSFVAGTLALAYGTMSCLYAAGVFVKSGRIAFETHWADKIAWFLQEPLPNALSLFVLNDDNHRDHWLYLGCAALVGALLVAGGWLEWRRHGRTRGIIWLSGLMGLPLFAFAVSMLASERYATYRTILAMTAVLLCFLVASVSALSTHWSANARRLLTALVISIALFTAQHHAYALIAVPQGNEWQLIMAGAKNVRVDGPRQRIFAIASTPADISTATIYHDEFGSLSSNSEWVPREMFKRAMHDLHPAIANLDSRYDFATGPKLPDGQHFDIIIDLHRLRRFYVDN